jgi:chemotaxis protein histidine kinase CheA
MQPNDRKRRMLPKYRRVTLDRLANLTTTIETADFASDGGDHAVLVKRELHTVKGEARLMGLTEISHLAHEVESLFILALETGSCHAHRDRLVEGLDYIGKLVEAPDPFALAPSPRLDELLRDLAQQTGGTGSGAVTRAKSPVPPAVASPPAESPRRAALVEKLRISVERRSSAIVENLRAFEAEAPDEDADRALKREIHTLKGDTRIVGFDLASEVAAQVEVMIKDLVVPASV